jgi:hypothetical protein
MMMLSVILFGMQIIAAYRVMRTSAEQEQPDERWFRSNNGRSAQMPEIQEQQDFSTDTYQPRSLEGSLKRRMRFCTDFRLTYQTLYLGLVLPETFRISARFFVTSTRRLALATHFLSTLETRNVFHFFNCNFFD